jgi:hypothetical protein
LNLIKIDYKSKEDVLEMHNRPSTSYQIKSIKMSRDYPFDAIVEVAALDRQVNQIALYNLQIFALANLTSNSQCTRIRHC